MCENEIGINARQSIALLAELLPYNSNLRNCFCENEAIVLDCEYFPVEPKYTTRYLNVLLECVTLIGKLVRGTASLHPTLELLLFFFFVEAVIDLCWIFVCCYKIIVEFIKLLQ